MTDGKKDRHRKILAGAAVLVALIVCAAGAYFLRPADPVPSAPPTATNPVPRPETIISAPTVKDIEDGDIIVRKGYGFWSEMAPAVCTRDRRYSHIGIMHVTETGEKFVIHANGDPQRRGHVKKEPLDIFLDRSRYWGLYRFDRDEKTRAAVAAKALEYAGKNVPFDEDFSLETTDKLYCSELVWRVAMDVTGRDIVPEKQVAMGKTYIGIDDIFLSPEMKPVTPKSP